MKKHIANNENLKHIIKIEEFSQDNFKTHIKSIDELFYYYIQECIHSGNDILISSDEIYNIMKVKELLELLGEFLKDIKDE